MIPTEAPVTSRVPIAATLAVGASACLAFAIEPFAGKVLLPRLGGSPSVWNTCVMVFQTLLLAGYGYSVLLVRMADRRKAFALHAALVVASIALWPFAVRALWLTPRAGWPPAAWIVVTTIAAIGLPFVILSATSPLLQVWLARASPARLNVHRLYAVSNTASVVGLVVYVGVLEPLVGVLRQSAVLWLGYACAMILALVAARRTKRAVTIGSPVLADRDPEYSESVVSLRSRLGWIALSFGASLCLYAVTTYVTTDVASFPLLWCLPLGLFLLGFAAGFSAWAARFRVWVIGAAKLAALAALVHLVWVEDSRTLWVGLLAPLLTLAFMVTALATELAHRRPAEDRLAGFYVWVGLGGVIAGVASVVVLPWAWSSFSLAGVPRWMPIEVLRSLSPLLFTETVPEYTAALLLSVWLLSKWTSGQDVWRLILGVSVAVGIAVVGTRFFWSGWSLDQQTALLGVAVAAAFIASRQGTRLLAASLALATIGGIVQARENEVLFEARNFFGTSRVQKADDVYQLKHGTTLHGIQPIGPDADTPASYYSWASPLGRVMDHLHPHNVVAVGLGVGTVAAYGQSGDRYQFLEINPLVLKIATNPAWFSYITAARNRGVTVDIAIGDGRLLAEKLDDGAWDLIVVDAFSSDAIPVHLLSLEAVRMFQHKLSARGVVAYHISNRFFDLQPVIAAAATCAGMSWAVQTREGLTATDYGSTWVMLARNDTSAKDAGLTETGWEQPAVPPGLAPWTDDWANVLGTMRSWKFWAPKDE